MAKKIVAKQTLFSSAAQVVINERGSKKDKQLVQAEWQRKAFSHWNVPELRYAVRFRAKSMARLKLKVARLDNEIPHPVAVRTLEQVGKSFGGDGNFLAQCAPKIDVVGEAYLLANTPFFGKPNKYILLSPSEITEKGGFYEVKRRRDGQAVKYPADKVTVTRLWQPHPEFGDDADSAMIALNETLDEYKTLRANVKANFRSGLNNGILLVPNEMSTPPVPDADGKLVDELLELLQEHMITPIEEEGSASSVVPMIFRGPAQHLDKIQHIIINRPLFDKIIELRNRVVDEFGRGFDLPPEIIKGMGESTNRATSWQIEAASYKIDMVPTASMIAAALTDGLLLPALRAAGVPDAEMHVVVVDSTELEQRKKTLEELMALYDRGLVLPEKLAALLDMNPDDISNTPEPPAAPVTPGAGAVDVKVDPVTADKNVESQSPLLAGASVSVQNALEWAGKKNLTHKLRSQINLPAWELHTAIPIAQGSLNSAFTASSAAWPSAPAGLWPLLQTYTQWLIDQRLPHSDVLLAQVLSRWEKDKAIAVELQRF